jgi:hypothetical protein
MYAWAAGSNAQPHEHQRLLFADLTEFEGLQDLRIYLCCLLQAFHHAGQGARNFIAGTIKQAMNAAAHTPFHNYLAETLNCNRGIRRACWMHCSSCLGAADMVHCCIC